MKSGTQLPPNPYINFFDFAQLFALPFGRIIISLSPSQIIDPTGITGVKAEVLHFKKTVFPDQMIYYSPDLTSPFSIPLPKVAGSPLWGMYHVTLTLILNDGQEFKETKSFNLCPVSNQSKESSLSSELSLSVDCTEGMIYLDDFVCRLYRGKLPTTMEYNLTHWFPPESGISPVKKISSIPYSNIAYNGHNKIAGYNDSTYSFENNISVLIRITGSIDKNVRCIPDFTSIYCGMSAMYDAAKACEMKPDEMAAKFNEAELLLWAITVGYQKGIDISDYILRLEEILGVSCACHGCDGEIVGAAPGCVHVDTISAENTNGTMIVKFNSSHVPVGTTIRISYAPFCDMKFIDVVPDTLSTGFLVDSAEFKVKYAGRHRVRVSTILNGRTCGMTEVDTGISASCPAITDINAQPVQ